ncbi:MAG TPA: site-specific integrase [Methylotenera sp.]|nr:site-specific integrase [Methylotenera sp.]HPH06598.1 site-specific integrase [Methylotenera sp.]HPN01842.1 site-specific integrase [Methylotenera sp.]
MADYTNFTKAFIENIAPPSTGRAEYHDSKVPGLRLRVTQNGIKTFCVFKRVKGGNAQRLTLGRYPSLSIEQARKMAAEKLLEIASGVNPAEIKRAQKAVITFDDLFKTYFTRHAKLRKKTADEDEQRYQQYLADTIGRTKIDVINKQSISALHNTITVNGHPAVANRVLALISTVFGRGVEWGIVNVNPCIGIRRNRELSRDRFLQNDELPRFIEALNLETNITARDFFWISMFTGARRSNVLSMKWSEVNLDEGVWRIPETKNGTPQNVPLTVDAIKRLHERKKHANKDAEYVFPGEGATGHLVEPFKAWKRILSRAGLKDLRIHDLRRTLGSWQAKTGASLSIIGKSLNHKSTQTTAIYARLDMDPVRQSVELATRAIMNAGVDKSQSVVAAKTSSLDNPEVASNLVTIPPAKEFTIVKAIKPKKT